MIIFLLLCSGFPLPGSPSSLPLLHLLDGADSDAAEALAHGPEQRVAERVHADGVDAADAVDLDQVALDARHHRPDVYKGQDGEEDSPDQRQGDAHQHRQQPVAPVLGHGEGGEAGFPDTVEAVGPCRLGDHVLEIHLKREEGEFRLEHWYVLFVMTHSALHVKSSSLTIMSAANSFCFGPFLIR